MKKRYILATVAVLVLVIAGGYAALVTGLRHIINRVSTINPIIPAMTSHTVKDVTYCRPQGLPQQLDLYIPDGGKTTFPLVVYVHGGSWVSGSKDEEAMADLLPTLADSGYVVAAIDYRLAPQFTFPAQVEDAKCAIRFLRAQAQQYHINPRRAGIIGESAGGYLAAFAGTTGDAKQFKTREYATMSDSLQAVVDIAGPSDFTATNGSASSAQIARNFLGEASPSVASPIAYVTKDDPPFLILHGQDDTIVPLSQSETLRAKLTSAGVPAKLVLVKNAGHRLGASSVRPSLNQLAVDILSFLHQELKS